MTEIKGDLPLDVSIKENQSFSSYKTNSQARQVLTGIENRLNDQERNNNILDNSQFDKSTNQPSTPDRKKLTIQNLNLKLKETRNLGKDQNSPTSQSSNDMSYKILHEILNSKSDDRIPVQSKIQSKLFESKKNLNLSKTIETTMIDVNTTKMAMEESEEVKSLQEKINELNKQLKIKKEILDSRKNIPEKDANPGNVNNKQLEDKLKSEYNNVKKKIDELQNYKQMFKSKTNIDAAKEKLKKLRKETTNYISEIQKLDDSIKKREVDINAHEKMIESEFGKQIKQLEEALNSVQTEKMSVHEQLNQVTRIYHQNLELKAMLKEDLNAKLYQRAELVAQREELDEIHEGLKASNKTELQFFFDEINLRDEVHKFSKYLNEVGTEKKKMLPVFEAILEEIKTINNQIFELDKSQQFSINEKNERMSADNEEIQKIEASINQMSIEIGIPELDYFFEELCGYYSSHIEKEILSKQLILIEDEEKKITEKFEVKEFSLLEAISITRSRTEDPLSQNELQELNLKLEQLRIRHGLRRESIQKWKNDVRHVLTEKSDREAFDHNTGAGIHMIYDRITNILKEKNVPVEDQKRFEEALSKYFRSVEQHEIFIHQKLQEEINLQEEKKLLEDKIERKRGERNIMEEKMKKLDEEFNRTLIQKKNLEQELNEKRAIIEHHLLKEADAAFNAYLSQQANNFDAITRTYGPKAAQNIKTEHHKEFIEITKNNQNKRIERFRQVQGELKYLDQCIEYNIRATDQEIFPSLNKVLESIMEGKKVMGILKKQQISLVETGDEITTQLHIIMQNRNAKLQKSSENYGNQVNQALLKMKETKALLEKKVNLADQEIGRLENQIIESDNFLIQLAKDEERFNKEMESVKNQLWVMMKPSQGDKEAIERDIRMIKKQIDELEMQKISCEQKYIEQNFLSDDYIPPTSQPFDEKTSGSNESFNEDLTKLLSFKAEENLQDKYKSNDEKEKYSPIGQQIELSPIKHYPTTPENNPKRRLFENNKDCTTTDNSKTHNESMTKSSGNNLNRSQAFTKKTPDKYSKDPNNSYLKNHKKKQTTATANVAINSLILENSQKSNKPSSQTSIPVLEDRENIFKIPEQNKPQQQNFQKQPLRDQAPVRDQPVQQQPSQVYYVQPTFEARPNSRKENIRPEERLNLPLQRNHSHDYDNNSKHQSFNNYSSNNNNNNNNSPRNVTVNINNMTYTNPNNTISNSIPQSLNSSMNGSLHIHKNSVNFPLKTIDEDQKSYREALRTNPNVFQFFDPADKQPTEVFNINNINTAKFVQTGKVTRGNSKSFSLDTSIQFDGNGSVIFDNRRVETNMNPQSSSALSFYRSYALPEDMTTNPQKYEHKQQPSISQLIAQNLKENANKRSRSAENKNNKSRVHHHAVHTEESEKTTMPSYGGTASVDAVRQNNKHQRDNSIGNRQKSIFKFKLDNCTLQDINFFESVKPLLEGGILFKKFTSYQSLKKQAFDPLMADIQPPELCGFGMRSLMLHRSLEKIEVRHTSKPGVEAIIAISTILRPVVPQITLDILKVQKRTIEGHDFPQDPRGVDPNQKTIFNQKGAVLNQKLEKCFNCQHYPFSVLLEKGGRIEFIAPSYAAFKEWINGLNCLMKYKKSLPKMRAKIETYCI